ncbi:MAG TPA: (deoxy)nucleoside triphosphate pyrophosphohydrolase [Galbitalea sp.]|jgi:8-oxo-dGTP diphosphatase|nr:(deoxy)nucleoside triphosphate pyrophosphohydrolase [Galbitalea sp.]
MPKHIDVVGAVIVRNGLIFCAQRGPAGALAGKWEFPGGKLERGESAAAALVREIREELDCEIRVGDEITTTVHEYEFGVVNLTTYYCELAEGEPTLSEHGAALWLEPSVLGSIEWAPADLAAVHLVQADLTSRSKSI